MTSEPAPSDNWAPPKEFDEYRLVRLLGQGSMGRVYLAHDTVLDRAVAVKFINRVADSEDRDRFFVEARAVARIQHPNVMVIYRVGELEGHPYLITEYIRGKSLNDLPLPLLWRRVLELAVGLQTARMRAQGQDAVPISATNYRHAWWTFAQMVAHHTSNGCNLGPGDLLGAVGAAVVGDQHLAGALVDAVAVGEVRDPLGKNVSTAEQLALLRARARADRGHHHPHLRASLLQSAGQFGALVGGNTAPHADDDAFAIQPLHRPALNNVVWVAAWRRGGRHAKKPG